MAQISYLKVSKSDFLTQVLIKKQNKQFVHSDNPYYLLNIFTWQTNIALGILYI